MATAVLSIGMGGMSALMLSATSAMSEAEHSSLAHLHADAMAATLMLSPLGLEHLANPPDSTEICFENEQCSNQDFLAGQYWLWRSRVAGDLPMGKGTVCRDSTPFDGDPTAFECDSAGPVVSKVFWAEPRHFNDADGGYRRAVVQLPE